MNDQNDFLPEVRNAALWSGDSRKIANGRSLDVFLEKTGQQIPEDISDKENVQWGHHLQPVIGQVAADKLGIQIKDADYSLTHPQHDWMRSHFDYISVDGRLLLECKNYNAGYRGKFGESFTQDIPAADWAQCLHEATVHRVENVTLAVLFGGQELCLFPLTFTDEQKAALIEQLSALWARIKTQEPPEPQNLDDAKRLFARDTGGKAIASMDVHNAALRLKQVKAQIKSLEQAEEDLQGILCVAMGEASELITPGGERLATWKASADSKRFDTKRFQAEMPKIYEQYLSTMPGSRRFLLK